MHALPTRTVALHQLLKQILRKDHLHDLGGPAPGFGGAHVGIVSSNESETSLWHDERAHIG